MTDNEKDEIDEAAEKRKKRGTGDKEHLEKDNDNGGRHEYKPCPLCGQRTLSLPAHLPCDDD